jgi:hypothetical protein
MARKQCFLVCPLSGNMARKQCFLVCLPSGNNARNNVSWFVHLQETWLGNDVFWFIHLQETWLGNNVSPSRNMARKQFSASMLSSLPSVLHEKEVVHKTLHNQYIIIQINPTFCPRRMRATISTSPATYDQTISI